MTKAAQPKTNEVAVITALSLGLGLVGIDRFLISTMFPSIARDLHLGYGDIGTIAGSLSIAWGISALLMGNMADRIGHRKVLVGSLIIFSVLIGASGLATGLMGLVVVRVIMGLADGAYTPACVAATIQASPPERLGRNLGMSQMTLSLFGLGFSPLLVAALLHVINWRFIFVLFLVPGLLLAWFTARNVPAMPVNPAPHTRSSLRDWKAVLSYANVRVLMVLMLCWLMVTITTSAFMPSYFIDHLKLSEATMGTVMSSIGFGAGFGTFALLWLSDKLGRKPVILLATVGGVLSLLALNSLSGSSAALLFMSLFMVHFCNNAAIVFTVGPICSETVPAALMATASGVIIAVGELLGGGLAPMVAGYFAEHYGIEHLLWLPIGALVLAFLLCLLLKETLPLAVRRQSMNVELPSNS